MIGRHRHGGHDHHHMCVCVCVRVHVHVSVCMRARVHVSVRTSVLEPWVVMCEARQATTRQEREVSHMAGMRGSGLSSLFPQERERGRERERERTNFTPCSNAVRATVCQYGQKFDLHDKKK